MSNLLISYLIEPVVRRARRFSNHSITHDIPRPSNPELLNDGVAATDNDGSLSEIMEENLQAWNTSLTIDNAVLDTISGQPVVQSPTAEYDSFEAELAPVHTASISVNPPLQNGVASASTSRRSTYRMDDDTSDNPLYGIPERFRSTTTSFSSSTHVAADATPTSVEGIQRLRGTTEHDAPRSAAASYSSWLGKGSLPADDGMGVMRKRIVEVRQMEASNEEKARLIHDLMTEKYSSSQTSLHAPRFARPHSPASLVSQERPFTPSSTTFPYDRARPPSTPTSVSPGDDPGNPYNITPDDLKPTFVPKPVHPVLPTPAGNSRVENTDQDSKMEEEEEEKEEERQLGCEHYRRNVKLQCSACSRWYTCRFCHDQVEDHSLNRRETKNMLCMLCRWSQPAGEICLNCGERGARYYCSVCKLWDDDNEKSIYHCNDCGICRVGQGLGKDFFHCKVCRLTSAYGSKSLTAKLDMLRLYVHLNSRYTSMH